jgi:glycosyltransferase involved in cell wall biosynthesis
LGWKKEQFFPFGYFPENEGLSLKKKEQNKTLQLLCTGYITKNKGQELLIRALKSIKNSEIKFHCTITGFGPEEETIKKLINDLNLVNEVTLTGVVGDSELNTIKSKTDLLIAPGYEEPWGIRINEAILAHTPVLVSDGIGACELIYKSKAGKVFKSGDINSLIEELEYLLNENNLLIAKENVKQYADRISPKAAAIYLYDVICFTLNKVKSKPTPVWLQDN